MQKIRNITIYLEERDIQYIDSIKIKNGLKSRNSTIGKIVQDHRASYDKLVEDITNNLKRELVSDLKELKKDISTEIINYIKIIS